MNLVRSLSFVLLFILFESVHGKLTCSNDVIGCMTEGAQNVYNSLVAGVKDLIEPIDPLHVETIDAEFPGLKYHLTNATMNGLRNCAVKLFKSDETNFNFELDLHCPKLVFTYHYDCKGIVLSSIDFDGEGFANIDVDNYYIIIKGKFKKFISLKDQKPHMSIVSHFIETDLKGTLTFKSDEQINPDKAKSDLGKAIMNENPKDLERNYLRSPFLESFMTLFVQRLDTYLANFSLDEVFPREEKKSFEH